MEFTQKGQFVTSWGSLGGYSTDLNFNGYDVAVLGQPPLTTVPNPNGSPD